MIPDADWFGRADFIILHYLSEHRYRIALTPAVVAKNTAMSKGHAQRRLGLLVDAGLINSLEDRGFYQINDQGERLITGNMSSERLEAIDPTEED